MAQNLEEDGMRDACMLFCVNYIALCGMHLLSIVTREFCLTGM